MRRILSHRPSPALALGTAVLLVALGGVAWAAIPGPAGIIHGCYSKHGGRLRVIDTAHGGRCGHGEVALAWSETGPAGSARRRRAANAAPPAAMVRPDRRVPTGPTGAQGPSNAFTASETSSFALTGASRDVLSLSLPAGRYAVSGSVSIANEDGAGGKAEMATCTLASAPVASAQATATAAVPFVEGQTASETVPLDGAWSLSQPETLELSCTQVSAGSTAASLARIDAVQVASIE